MLKMLSSTEVERLGAAIATEDERLGAATAVLITGPTGGG